MVPIQVSNVPHRSGLNPLKRAASDLPCKELDSGISDKDSLRISVGPLRSMAPHGRSRNGSRGPSVFRTFMVDQNGLTVPFVAFDGDRYFKQIKHGK